MLKPFIVKLLLILCANVEVTVVLCEGFKRTNSDFSYDSMIILHQESNV
jgi:hypothetical protein